MNCPWMPLYVADYIADTMHLRAAESGAYLHLIMHYWRNDGLPDDDRQLALIARMTDDEWKLARPLIEPLFKAGKWKHKRIEAELAKAKQKSEAGRKSAEARWGAMRTHCDGNADDGNAPVTVSVEDTVTKPKEDSPNNKIDSQEERLSVTRARARTGMRLPENWTPTEADLSFAGTILPNQQILMEIERFRDHWRAANGPPSVKRDWSAAWRNWCRKAVEFGARNGQHRQGRNGSAVTSAINAIIDNYERAEDGDGKDRPDIAGVG